MPGKSRADNSTISHQCTSKALQTPRVDVFEGWGHSGWFGSSGLGVVPGDHLLNTSLLLSNTCENLGHQKPALCPISLSECLIFVLWYIEQFFTITTTTYTQNTSGNNLRNRCGDDHVKLVGDSDELLHGAAEAKDGFAVMALILQTDSPR